MELREDVMSSPSLAEARAAFESHLARFQAAGHDRLDAVRFVAEAAGTWTAPALDIGTGKGLLAIELATRGGAVTSLDTNADEQLFAKARASDYNVSDRIRFITGDAASLPFPDKTFGLVAMMNVLHHLDTAEPVFSEMVRVLAPGGLILIGEFDRDGFALVARIHAEEGRTHPVGPVTMDVARSRLSAAGLSLKSSRAGMLHEVVVFG